MRWRWLLLILLAMVGSGCATLRSDLPALSTERPAPAYDIQALQPGPGNSDEVIVVASFSGGGARASAFGLGVLDAMAETRHGGSDLYRELDVVSGVSGGSMLAAFVAMDPEAALRRFEPDVLRSGLERRLVHGALSPRGAGRLLSPRYGRGDLLQDVLDARVFHGLRYGDLARRGTLPYLAIHAADVHGGKRFTFDAERFAQLCSDLDALPVARAVAASSALPLIFSPVAIPDHGHDCRARVMPDQKHYVHLVDGGLADNLAIGNLSRIAIADAEARGDAGPARVPREVIVVSVDASLPPDHEATLRADTPGSTHVLMQMADNIIAMRAGQTEAEYAVAAQRYRDSFGGLGIVAPQVHHLRIRLRDIASRIDEGLLRTPTKLDLPDATVQALRRAGREAFMTEWQTLLARGVPTPHATFGETVSMRLD